MLEKPPAPAKKLRLEKKKSQLGKMPTTTPSPAHAAADPLLGLSQPTTQPSLKTVNKYIELLASPSAGVNDHALRVRSIVVLRTWLGHSSDATRDIAAERVISSDAAFEAIDSVSSPRPPRPAPPRSTPRRAAAAT